jgi:hypothetical protein
MGVASWHFRPKWLALTSDVVLGVLKAATTGVINALSLPRFQLTWPTRPIPLALVFYEKQRASPEAL